MNGIIILGSPGSGKSVVGKLLNKYMQDSVYISSGDIARKLAENDDEIKRQLEIGEMATEDQMRIAVTSSLYNINIHNKMFILDGFPRTIEQVEVLENQFPNIKYIYVDVSSSTCAYRMINRNRGDDNSENISKRLKFYEDETLPMIKDLALGGKIANTYNNEDVKEDFNFVIDVYNILKEIMEEE